MKCLQSRWQREWTLLSFVLVALYCAPGCTPKAGPGASSRPATSAPEAHVTMPDKSALLQRTPLVFSADQAPAGSAVIAVDSAQKFQDIDGFGFTLTGGSATLINSLPADRKEALLRELFGSGPGSIGISYLRISIGASDLSAAPFTYNELPEGRTDTGMQYFSLDPERADLLPVLKRILALSPAIKIMGSPRTPPRWMKTNGSFIGGNLKPEFYAAYARYFVRYIKEMRREGIPVDAITIQNEPLHPGNNPSLYMTAAEQAAFIKGHLGPVFRKEGITTKIIIYDHNCDRPDYPLAILNDPEAKAYVDGSAFHLYAGSINALSQVHNAHPDRHVYFTEQWIGGPGNFGGDLKWHIENLIIGATRNWSRNVLEWNLAADAAYNPHTDKGGCTNCLGALTIDGDSVSRNTAYYIIAHASAFVPPGSVRIATAVPEGLPNVGFLTPGGKKVVIVLNSSATAKTFRIALGGRSIAAQLEPGAVGTYTWQ